MLVCYVRSIRGLDASETNEERKKERMALLSKKLLPMMMISPRAFCGASPSPHRSKSCLSLLDEEDECQFVEVGAGKIQEFGRMREFYVLECLGG